MLRVQLQISLPEYFKTVRDWKNKVGISKFAVGLTPQPFT